MKAKPSFQFYPSDWLRDPGLRSCSLAARGLWIDMLSFMHEGEPYGHLRLNGQDIQPTTLARMVGTDVRTVRRLLAELLQAGVYSLAEPGTIFSRRMVRDQELRERRAKYGYLSEKHPDVPKRKDRGKDTFKDTFPTSIGGSFGGSPSSSSSSSSSKEEEKRAVSTASKPADLPPKKRTLQLSDQEFLTALHSNPAYTHLDIGKELGKLDAWLLTPKGRGKHKTRQRVVNWLNKAADEQRPVTTTNGVAPSGCMEKVLDQDGRYYVHCGGAIVTGQERPFCVIHLASRQHFGAQLVNGRAS